MTVTDGPTSELAEKTIGMLLKAYRTDVEGDNKKNTEPEKEDPAPADQKPEIRTNISKWKIPFHFKTQSEEYHKAYSLCRKHKLPYPEALKKQEESKGVPDVIEQPAVPEQGDDRRHLTFPPNYKDIIRNTANPEKTERLVTYEVPAEILDLSRIPLATNIVNRKVKQIRPDRGQQFSGTAIILARERNGQLITVRDSGGKTHKVDAKCLELIPEAK